MKLYFRPFLGLTIATAVALVILISLGTWQFKRLQWKTALLAEVEQVTDAPPFTSLSQIQAALDAGEPIDFRRFGSRENIIYKSPAFLSFTAANGGIGWRVFSPIRNSDITAFAAMEIIKDADRDQIFGAEVQRETAVDIVEPLAGYVRLSRPDKKPATESSPDKNRWFGFNPLPGTSNWGDNVNGNPDMRFYIDTVPSVLNAQDLPARRPNIRNNHLDYMLTWYGLALVLLIIYLIMHRRAGRLGLS